MKRLKIFILIGIMVLGVLTLSGCRQADRVSYNIGKEADNFNVTRRIVVYNARTDKLVFELIGNFSIHTNSTHELEILCEVDNNVYKKHFVYLNDWTLYVVEDVSGAYVDKYHYEVNYIPEMIIPVTFTSKD